MVVNLYVNVHQNNDNFGSLSIFVFGTPGESVDIASASGFSQNVTIGVDGSVSVPLPLSLAMSGTGVNDQGLQISSEGDISAYLSNRRTFTTDLTVIFEEASLGTSYVLASGATAVSDGGQFSAQAIVDGTELSFTLPDGQLASVTLDAGESFKFSTADSVDNAALGINVTSDFDLTGTIVSSNQPLAVFSGHACAFVGQGACDHLVEQMPPIESLSQDYVVGEAFSSAGLGNNLIRVVAAEDDTEVRVDGELVATLSQGEFHEFTLSEPASTIQTSNPALVAQYLQGAITAGEGDPALSFVPGTDTWLSSYVVATPSGEEALAQNLVNIVIPTSAVSSLEINGADVDDASFTAVEGTGLSVANIPVQPGIIRAEASENFQLSLFGFDSFDSFLTFGGANFASGLSNVPPEPANDLFAVDEEATIAGNLFADNGNGPDQDRDGDELSVVAVNGMSTDVGSPITLANGAQLQVEANGDFTYIASLDDDLDAGETIIDSFTYTVSDGTATRQGTVEVEVRGADGDGGDGQIGLALTVPDELAPGEVGSAEVTVTNTADAEDGSPDLRGALLAVSTERGLVADPLTGAFSDTAFVLGTDGDGTLGAGESALVDVDIKGTAGPRSTLSVQAQVADPSATTDIGARVTALQPAFLSDEVRARIEANVVDRFGDTVATLTETLFDHADQFTTFGLDGRSATSALAFALDVAGDFGSIAERGMTGSHGQGWASVADIGLDIDGGSVRMSGITDIDALRSLSIDGAALYTASTSAGRSVTLGGNVLALTPPARPTFEQGSDGSFQNTSAFDGELKATADGFSLELDNGDRLTFDETGNFLAMVWSDGREVIASRDGDGQITQLAGTNGSALDFTRDGEGRITSIEDADGVQASFAYDANGNLATVTRPEGTSTFAYDANGDLIGAAAPGAITSDLAYDAAGRLQAVSFGGGLQSETFAYDDRSAITVTDGAGRSVALELLPGSIAARITDGEGNSSELVYDEAGDLIGARAPDGSFTGFEFDAQDRLTKITDANGAELSFTYGEDREEPLSFTDAGGGTRSFAYDTGGRITEATWPDGTSLAFAYDAEGNLTAYTNRRGDDVDYTYDARGRLLSESDSSAGPTSYVYDARGRLVSATNDQGETTLAYDAADRVTEINYPTGRSLFYSYNEAGLRASMSDGAGYDLFYDYDAIGRLTGLRDGDGTLVTYDYDAAGNLIREANANGTVSTYAYDAAGRLTVIENQAPDSSLNSRFAYSYDEAGQRIAAETLDGTWTYGYDAIGQLTSADFASTNGAIPDKSITYDYDAAGNRTRVVEDGVETLYVANALNQYTQVGDATLAYDDDGNLLSRTDNEGTTTYAYDLDNRLVQVTEADGTVLDFEYDVFGNRIAKTVDGTATDYLVDPFGLGDVISEFSGGTQTVTYAHGLDLAAGNIGGADVFYDVDAVGSVSTVTGNLGTVENSYVYDPFGRELFEVEGLQNDFEFNGALGVAEDGEELDYMRARYYSDELGRFYSEDPLFMRGSPINLNSFVANNPISFVDPEGANKLLLLGGVVILTILTVQKRSENAREEQEERNQKDKESFKDGPPTGDELKDMKKAEVEAGKEFLEGLIGDIYGGAGKKTLNKPAQKAIDAAKAKKLLDSINEDESQIDEDSTVEDISPLQASPNSASERDPHIHTFDRSGYSFQTVGEFTLVQGDDFEIQTRQEPIGPNVSANTATVMKIGEHAVGIYAQEDVPLVIDGRPVILELEQSIAVGDGTVHRSTFRGGGELGDFDVYVVTDGKGNGFWVNVYFGANHLRPFVAEGSEVSGLLGNLNGDPLDDFQLRDGTVLPRPLPQTILYGEFADSWRIDQADSLFIYGEGESTETFTDRNFPSQIVTIDDLDPVARAEAEAIALAAGLQPGTFEFETTVIDIAITGDPIFAEGVAGAPNFNEEGEEVDIIPVLLNEAPVLGDDEATVGADGVVEIDVLANDDDPEGDGLQILAAEDANGGLVEIVGNLLRFTPAPGFSGETQITYQVGDDAGNVVEGLVRVTVEGEGSGGEDGQGFITDEDTPFTTADVLANDVDVDGDTLVVSAVDATGISGLVTNNGDGTFDYDPNGAFEFLGNGDSAFDSFVYTVDDGNGGTDTATVTLRIDGVNDAPDAVDDVAETVEDEPVVINVLDGDTDVEGDTLTVVAVGAAANGAAVINDDGTITYAPNAGFFGTDSFTYTVDDGNGGTDTATVTVTVEEANQAPVVSPIEVSFGEDETGRVLDLLSGATDEDGDELSVDNLRLTAADGREVASSLEPETGLLILDDGQFEDLAADETLEITVDYDVTDGEDTVSNTATITIDGANDTPIARDDGFVVQPSGDSGALTIAAADDTADDTASISPLAADQFAFKPDVDARMQKLGVIFDYDLGVEPAGIDVDEDVIDLQEDGAKDNGPVVTTDDAFEFV